MNTYENQDQDNTTEEHAIEFIALVLNHIAKEDGIEGLQGHSWVTMVVENAQRVGITNASEEMLIERFKNEGVIHLVKDLLRCDTGVLHNQMLSASDPLITVSVIPEY